MTSPSAFSVMSCPGRSPSGSVTTVVTVTLRDVDHPTPSHTTPTSSSANISAAHTSSTHSSRSSSSYSSTSLSNSSPLFDGIRSQDSRLPTLLSNNELVVDHRVSVNQAQSLNPLISNLNCSTHEQLGCSSCDNQAITQGMRTAATHGHRRPDEETAHVTLSTTPSEYPPAELQLRLHTHRSAPRTYDPLPSRPVSPLNGLSNPVGSSRNNLPEPTVVHSSSEDIHPGPTLPPQSRRVAVTSCITMIIMLLATIIYSCVKLNTILKMRESNSSWEDSDPEPEPEAENGIASSFAMDVYTIKCVEQSLSCSIIALSCIAVFYSVWFLRNIWKDKYRSFYFWVIFMAVIILIGTTFTLFDAICQKFEWCSTTALICWFFMIIIMCNTVRSICPIYKQYKSVSQQSEDCALPLQPLGSIGTPPPLYSIAGTTVEEINVSDNQVAPPTYQPTMITPPQYDQIVAKNESQHPLPVNIKPPRYRP